jgi:hypothetical protein
MFKTMHCRIAPLSGQIFCTNCLVCTSLISQSYGPCRGFTIPQWLDCFNYSACTLREKLAEIEYCLERDSPKKNFCEIIALNYRLGLNFGFLMFELNTTKNGAVDVKKVYLIWKILLKHAVKIGCVVKQSAEASCAFCLWTPGVRPVDHQRVAYR